jgi:hypothetical protein
MRKPIPYTLQELIMRDACARLGYSFVMLRDHVTVFSAERTLSYRIQH